MSETDSEQQTDDPKQDDSPGKSAPETANAGIWDTIAAKPEFNELLAHKFRVIIPMCVFFMAYYFALPLLVGLAPDLMSKKVWGSVNVAYLFALSQFFMTWIVAIIYARVADHFDRQAHDLVGEHQD